MIQEELERPTELMVPLSLCFLVLVDIYNWSWSDKVITAVNQHSNETGYMLKGAWDVWLFGLVSGSVPLFFSFTLVYQNNSHRVILTLNHYHYLHSLFRWSHSNWKQKHCRKIWKPTGARPKFVQIDKMCKFWNLSEMVITITHGPDGYNQCSKVKSKLISQERTIKTK